MDRSRSSNLVLLHCGSRSAEADRAFRSVRSGHRSELDLLEGNLAVALRLVADHVSASAIFAHRVAERRLGIMARDFVNSDLVSCSQPCPFSRATRLQACDASMGFQRCVKVEASIKNRLGDFDEGSAAAEQVERKIDGLTKVDMASNFMARFPCRFLRQRR